MTSITNGIRNIIVQMLVGERLRPDSRYLSVAEVCNRAWLTETNTGTEISRGKKMPTIGWNSIARAKNRK